MKKAEAEEFVPTEEDEQEVSGFKVKKGPRYMSPQEVRAEGPQPKSYKQAPRPIKADDEEHDEAWAPPRRPHKPLLEDGKRYNAEITKMEVLKDQPVWNRPDRLQDVLVYTFDINGVEIRRRVTKSTGEMSNLNKLAKEFGFGDISLTGFDGRKLLGKSCRVKIHHSKPTVDGSVFDNVDIDSVESLAEP